VYNLEIRYPLLDLDEQLQQREKEQRIRQYDQDHKIREAQRRQHVRDQTPREIRIRLQDRVEAVHRHQLEVHEVVLVDHRHLLEAQEVVLADLQDPLDQAAEVALTEEDNSVFITSQYYNYHYEKNSFTSCDCILHV
jgi:hypothetical protein